ncbi:MAG: transglutaminase-like cysteine peptidase [Pseudomonadota bacterium]
MSGSISSRGFTRAVTIALASVVLAWANTANAAPGLEQASRTVAEPFGLATQALPEGPLSAKWHGVERAIQDELKIIAACRSDRSSCASIPALQFLKIVDDALAQTGLARVGEINRAFNLAIRPVSDQTQYGVEDLWTSPLATLAAGAGDCEDYAIAKFVALREAGVSPDDLRLVILRGISSGEDHAVLAVRIEGRWRMLDNRYFLMLEDCDVTKFEPLFAIDAGGAKRFEQPSVAVAALNTKMADEALSTSAIDPQISSMSTDEFCQTHPM